MEVGVVIKTMEGDVHISWMRFIEYLSIKINGCMTMIYVMEYLEANDSIKIANCLRNHLPHI
jgi:hypothetical protein